MKKYCLKDVADIYSGATPLTKNKHYYEDGSIAWITPKDLSGYTHKYIYSGQRNITEEGYRSCATNLLPKGTVIFSSRAPIGYVAIAGSELCTNQGFKSFVCKEDILFNEYLYYYLLQNRKKIEALGNGSTFKEVSRKTLANYEIELPSLDAQKDIVKELVILDEKYENNCNILTNIELLMEYLYCKFFQDNERNYEAIPIAELVEIVTGGTPSTKNDTYWNNGMYYWYTPTDVTTGGTMLALSAEKKISVSGLANSGAKLIPAKSVIMTSRATIGEAIINLNEATTNQGILSLIPKDDKITALEIYFWVKRNKQLIASIANGSTFKEIYKKDFGKLLINVQEKAQFLFREDTEKLFEFYESLLRENVIISELRGKLLATKF
ncbi:MAG: hypothetical protein HFH65_12630 [Lachnospiraceae bacterium]|nr:hypothetical protein [Lachnospiraceae bacterium]